MRAIILAITLGTLMPAASHAQDPLGTPVNPAQADSLRPQREREMATRLRQRALMERSSSMQGARLQRQLAEERLRAMQRGQRVQVERARMQRARVIEQALSARRAQLANPGLLLNGVDLTEEQRERMKAIRENLQKQREELRDERRELEKEHRDLQKETRERMLEVLTAEQRRQVEQRAVRRGGGGGRR